MLSLKVYSGMNLELLSFPIHFGSYLSELS